MRLAYQSFGQEAGMERYREALAVVLNESVGSEHELTILELGSALVEGKGFSSAQAVEVPALLRSLAAAADAGFDAIAIGNGFDPGLWDARELLDVPVLSLFETVAFVGLRVGWRLGVLCTGRSGPARIEEIASRYGIASRLTRPTTLGVTVPHIMAAFSDVQIANELTGQIHAAVSELADEGAETVLIASGALDVFYQVHGGAATEDIPVLPAVRILAHELAAAATMSSQGLPVISRVGRFRSPPMSVQRLVRGSPSQL